jgi:hypothetical protein
MKLIVANPWPIYSSSAPKCKEQMALHFFSFPKWKQQKISAYKAFMIQQQLQIYTQGNKQTFLP